MRFDIIHLGNAIILFPIFIGGYALLLNRQPLLFQVALNLFRMFYNNKKGGMFYEYTEERVWRNSTLNSIRASETEVSVRTLQVLNGRTIYRTF